MKTNAELIAELQALDGDLPARVTAADPGGNVQSYDITGVASGPASYGLQVSISID